ncbi:hypothetical protein [Tolypothrix sp. VBCCA 56010]
MGQWAWGIERIVLEHALLSKNLFNSHCPMPIAHCPMPNAQCPKSYD